MLLEFDQTSPCCKLLLTELMIYLLHYWYYHNLSHMGILKCCSVFISLSQKNANLEGLRELKISLGMLSVFDGMYFDKRSTI